MRSTRGGNIEKAPGNMAVPPMSQPTGFYGSQSATVMRPATGRTSKGIMEIVVTAIVSSVMTAILVLLVCGMIQSHAISEAEALAKDKTEQLEKQQTDIDAAKDAVRTANEELKGKIDSFTQTIESQRAEIESLRARTEEQQSIIDEAKASGLIGEGE